MAKVGGIFVRRAVTMAPIGVNKNGTCLRIRVTRRNCGVRKQNDALARLRPTEAVATGAASRRIYCDERVISCTRVCQVPCCLCDFGRKRNDAEARVFHQRKLNPHSESRIGEIQAANSAAAFLWKALSRP